MVALFGVQICRGSEWSGVSIILGIATLSKLLLELKGNLAFGLPRLDLQCFLTLSEVVKYLRLHFIRRIKFMAIAKKADLISEEEHLVGELVNEKCVEAI